MVTTTHDTSARASTAPAERPTSESRVDRESHFNGVFQAKQNLRVEGVAEGEIRCDSTLTIAEGARVKAKVMANNVTVAGELEGEAVCRDVFQIMPSGKVEATVSAKRLIVHEGGFYSGEFHMIQDGTAFPEAKVSSAQTSSRQVSGQDNPAADRSSVTVDEQWTRMMSEGAPAPSEDTDNTEP